MTRKAWTPEEINIVTVRYTAGEDDDDIAAALGRSTGSVSNCRQLHHIQRPQETLKRAPKWTDEHLELANSMYVRGDSLRSIAAATGRSRIAMKRLVSTYRLKRNLELCGADPKEFDTPTEEWRRIEGHFLYAVSSQGRVMSLQPARRGCILYQWANKDGYLNVQLQVNGKSKRYRVQRLLTTAFHGPAPSPVHQAAHNDGVPERNTIENLRWATPKENQADRKRHGTAKRSGNKFAPCREDMLRQARAAGHEPIEVRAC